MAQWAGCFDKNVWSQDFFLHFVANSDRIIPLMIIKAHLMCKNPSSVWVNRNRYHLASSKEISSSKEERASYSGSGESVQNSLAENGSCLPWSAPRNHKVWKRCFSILPARFRCLSFCSLLHIYLRPGAAFLHLGGCIWWWMLPFFLHDLPLHESSRQIRVWCLHSTPGKTSCLDLWKQALSSPRVQIAVPEEMKVPFINPVQVSTFWRRAWQDRAVTLGICLL